MPSTLSFPGVYIEEVSSGVHTITGVATSVTAFVGRTLRGPTDEEAAWPVAVFSFGEFARTFGGLWEGSALGFAVRDFFQNGGNHALIVRCFRPSAGGAKAKATLSVNGLALVAATPGAWSNGLRVRVDQDVRPNLPTEAANSLFNLTLKDTTTGVIEVFRNVSVTAGHPRRVDRVLAEESSLARVDSSVANAIPANRPAAHVAVPAGDNLFDDAVAARYTTVQPADQATDGLALRRNEISDPGLEATKRGMYALLKADIFNLLCIPAHKLKADPDSTAPVDVEAPTLINEAAAFCKRQRAFLIVDPPYGATKDTIKTFQAGIDATNYAALFFPGLKQPNPLHDDQMEEFVPCGAVAGVFARTDAQRGVWKAPAGQEARLNGVPALSISLTDPENGVLNQLGINCLRALPAAGRVVWGARTLEGNDRLASEWKYIPVRRTALFIEESLYRGTQWVVFEPNDEPLWAQIRLNLGAFMNTLFRQGAFQGKTPREAYFVKCDAETTTQNDINAGIVNIVVGFAPLKPAEFVVIKIQQIAGEIAT